MSDVVIKGTKACAGVLNNQGGDDTMVCASLGEWGQVQEETNFHWHKRASDKRSTAQRRGGILRSHESQWERGGGKAKIFILYISRYFTVCVSHWVCTAVCMIRHSGYDSQLWSYMLKSFWRGYFDTSSDYYDHIGEYFRPSYRVVVSGQMKTGFRSATSSCLHIQNPSSTNNSPLVTH